MKIAFVGDVTMGNSKCNSGFVDDRIKELFSEHDHVVCNLEGCIYDPSLTKEKKVGAYCLNSYDGLSLLKASKVDTFFLANNHIMDYGTIGLRKTIDVLDSESLYHAGAGFNVSDIFSPLVFYDAEVSVGILNVSEKQFGVCNEGENVGYAWMMHHEFWEKLREVTKQVDYTVIVCHAGAEDIDVPLPEIRRLYKRFIDYGASLVIGHHPHVIQGHENYRGAEIYYSLGNFYFKADSYDNGYERGCLVSVVFNRNGISTMPHEILNNNGVVELTKCTRIREVSKLLVDDYIYEECLRDSLLMIWNQYLKNDISMMIGFNNKKKESIEKFCDYRRQDVPINYDKLLILHNFANETKRWMIEETMRMKLKGDQL